MKNEKKDERKVMRKGVFKGRISAADTPLLHALGSRGRDYLLLTQSPAKIGRYLDHQSRPKKSVHLRKLKRRGWPVKKKEEGDEI